MFVLRLLASAAGLLFVGAAFAQTTSDRIVFRDNAVAHVADVQGSGPWYYHHKLGASCLVPVDGILKKEAVLDGRVVARVEKSPGWWPKQILWDLCAEQTRVYMRADTWDSFVAGNGKLHMFAKEEAENNDFAKTLKELGTK